MFLYFEMLGKSLLKLKFFHLCWPPRKVHSVSEHYIICCGDGKSDVCTFDELLEFYRHFTITFVFLLIYLFLHVQAHTSNTKKQPWL